MSKRSWQSNVYRFMRTYNDAQAVERAVEHHDSTYVTRRIGRRMWGRASAKISRALFPPHHR